MKNIFTKALLAVFCVAAVLTYSMEANAEEGHLCEAEIDYSSFRKYNPAVYVDCGENHAFKGYYNLVCKVCRSYMGNQDGYGDYESHRYTSYENEWHNNNMTHSFIICCGTCGHRQHISIECNYEELGFHSAPW